MPDSAQTVVAHAVVADHKPGRGFGRVYLEVRQSVSARWHALVITLSLVFGLGVSLIILLANGVELASIYEEFIVLTFFDSLGVSNVLIECSPLILVGLAAAVAFSVNFWNIGIEGQFFWGVIGATIVAIYDVGPEEMRIYLMFVGAALGGALWTVVPLVLKLKLNVNEVVSTLLLNYIAFYFVMNQVYGPWQDPVDKFYHTEQFGLAERLPQLGWERVHVGIFVALAAVVVIWWLLSRSRFGVYTRFVGSNGSMALASGIPVALTVGAAVLVSGALSGTAGYIMAAGQEYRMTPSMAAGYGFSGIVIAFLARNNPLAVLLVAVLMGGLYVAGQSLKVFYGLPAAMVGLVQAIIVLSVATSHFFVRYRVHWAR